MAIYNKQAYYKQTAKDYVNSGFNMSKALKKRHKEITNQGIRVKGSRLLANDNFKQELKEYLTNLTPNLQEKAKELLNAKKVAVHQGEAILTDAPDYKIQSTMFKEIATILDVYPAQKHIQTNVKLEIKAKLQDLNEFDLKNLLTHKTP